MTNTTRLLAALVLLALVPAAQATSLVLPQGHAIEEWHGPTGTQVVTTTHFGHTVATFSGPPGLVVVKTKGPDNATTVQGIDLPADAPDHAQDIAALQSTVNDLEATVANLTANVANTQESIAATRAELAALGAKLQTATAAAEGAKRAAEDIPRHNLTALQEDVRNAAATAEKARGVGFIAATAAMLGCLIGAAGIVVARRQPRSTLHDDGGPLAPEPSRPAPPPGPAPEPAAQPPPGEVARPVPTDADVEAWLAKQLKDNPSLAPKLASLGAPAPA